MIACTFISALTAAAILLVMPERYRIAGRWLALAAAVTGTAFALAATLAYDRSPTADPIQFATRIEWIPALGVSFHIAADGISLLLLLLTGAVAIAGVLFSWNIEHRSNRFFGLFLLIIAGAYGVFVSFDVVLLLVFYEIVILPKYLLIAGWGSTNREYGAMKLTIYSIVGSTLVLIAIMATYVVAGATTFDLFALAATKYPTAFQLWAFPVMFLGFAILAGIWPFHTWAPTGHVAAPTAASMLLAGVVMKLGAYGALRVAMPLFPEGLAHWRMLFAVLAAIGILYGALTALAQRDLKFVIGYSSISHMGFVLLGLLTFSAIGIGGAVVQMISHGIIAALLFAIVGRMIYDRTHTRDIAELGQLGLFRALPFVAFTFVIAATASMGLPGFSGFIAEMTILLGVWETQPMLLVLAGTGAVITVTFTLKAMSGTLFSDDAAPQSHPQPPVTCPEICAALLLIALTLGLGIYPGPVLDLIFSSFDSDLMAPLLK